MTRAPITMVAARLGHLRGTDQTSVSGVSRSGLAAGSIVMARCCCFAIADRMSGTPAVRILK